MRTTITRRAILGLAAFVPLAGCAGERPVPQLLAGTAHKEHAREVVHDRLVELERSFEARLGVSAPATGTGTTVTHRADERFASCSTFKALATAAVLHRNPLAHLEKFATYADADLMDHAPITERHVANGMTIRQLCDAAVRYSDGTAGNLLLRELGGPVRLTAYPRGLCDTVTRMDRIEPAITEATPGDPRDTSSPRAFGGTFHKIVLGNALPPEKRAFLRDLLERNMTGAGRIRAGLPHNWTAADKTGTGSCGTINDMAIVWPPKSAPLVIAIMSSKQTEEAEHDEDLIAKAAE